jgi:hypothetical protein
MKQFFESFIKPIWFITKLSEQDDNIYTLIVISKGITRSLITTNNKEYLLKEKNTLEFLYNITK